LQTATFIYNVTIVTGERRIFFSALHMEIRTNDEKSERISAFTYLSYSTWAVLSSRGPFDLRISFVDSGDLWAATDITCHCNINIFNQEIT
jgi:hypothetical protein